MKPKRKIGSQSVFTAASLDIPIRRPVVRISSPKMKARFNMLERIPDAIQMMTPVRRSPFPKDCRSAPPEISFCVRCRLAQIARVVAEDQPGHHDQNTEVKSHGSGTR